MVKILSQMKKGIQVKQRDVSDCGPACLASVAAYFGLHIPVSRIRKYVGTDKQGTSLHGLIEAAEQFNFQARGAKAAGIALSGIPVPAIFHLVLGNGLQHFVGRAPAGAVRSGIVFISPGRSELGAFACGNSTAEFLNYVTVLGVVEDTKPNFIQHKPVKGVGTCPVVFWNLQ